VVDLVLPAIYYIHGQPLSVPCREIIYSGYGDILYRDNLYTQGSGKTGVLVVRDERAEDLERVRAARDQHAREFTRDQGQVIAGDPAEWLGGPFQEHFSAGLVLLAPRIAIGDRLDGHSITDLSPEGLEFGLDPLAVFLPELLILQPLLEVIHGHKSHGRFLRRSLARVPCDHQTMLQPILAVGQIHDADPTGGIRSAPCHPYQRVFHDGIEI
jgi:hypothetical protein